MYSVFIGNNLLFTQALSCGDDFLELVMEEKKGRKAFQRELHPFWMPFRAIGSALVLF